MPNPSNVFKVEKGREMLFEAVEAGGVDDSAGVADAEAEAAAAGVFLANLPFFLPPVPAKAPQPSVSSRSFLSTVPSGWDSPT